LGVIYVTLVLMASINELVTIPSKAYTHHTNQFKSGLIVTLPKIAK
jgi:hypothetical protein